jgi:hypothetical protein
MDLSEFYYKIFGLRMNQNAEMDDVFVSFGYCDSLRKPTSGCYCARFERLTYAKVDYFSFRAQANFSFGRAAKAICSA